MFGHFTRRSLHCCRRHKFAIQAFYAVLNIFILLRNMQLNNTHRAHCCKNTYTNVPPWFWMVASRCAWIRIMITIVCVSTTVFITRGNYTGYMFRLLNRHLQAYSLQVKSQDAVHTLGSQCVYIREILKSHHLSRKVSMHVYFPRQLMWLKYLTDINILGSQGVHSILWLNL